MHERRLKSDLRPGEVFGRLTVVEEGTRRGNKRYFICECICGNKLSVCACNLLNDNTKSCGCLNTELRLARSTTHGESGGDLYSLWGRIKQRCFNEKCEDAHNYLGRGIIMYSPWVRDYGAFAFWIRKNIGERPSKNYSLDRINNDGNYEPGNLRWATQKIQSNNQRTNALLTCDGRTQTRAEWAREVGLSAATILARQKAGRTDEEAIKTKNMRPQVWLTSRGKTQKAKDWAQELGVEVWIIYYRHRRGWTDEQTLWTPVQATIKEEKE